MKHSKGNQALVEVDRFALMRSIGDDAFARTWIPIVRCNSGFGAVYPDPSASSYFDQVFFVGWWNRLPNNQWLGSSRSAGIATSQFQIPWKPGQRSGSDPYEFIVVVRMEPATPVRSCKLNSSNLVVSARSRQAPFGLQQSVLPSLRTRAGSRGRPNRKENKTDNRQPPEEEYALDALLGPLSIILCG